MGCIRLFTQLIPFWTDSSHTPPPLSCWPPGTLCTPPHCCGLSPLLLILDTNDPNPEAVPAPNRRLYKRWVMGPAEAILHWKNHNGTSEPVCIIRLPLSTNWYYHNLRNWSVDGNGSYTCTNLHSSARSSLHDFNYFPDWIIVWFEKHIGFWALQMCWRYREASWKWRTLRNPGHGTVLQCHWIMEDPPLTFRSSPHEHLIVDFTYNCHENLPCSHKYTPLKNALKQL